MNHKAYIRLVYPHAKSNGSYNDINALHDKIILRLRPGSRIHSGMIGPRVNVVRPEYFGQLLHPLTAQSVNNTALPRTLFDEPDNILIYILGLVPYLVIQVRTIKRAFKLLGVRHPQVLFDVAAYLIGCRSRQGYHRCRTDFVDYRANPPVFRPKVVPPFRYTMRLVYRIKRNFHIPEKIHILVFRQRFRSYIKQLGLPVQNITLHHIYRPFVQRRIQIMGNAVISAHRPDCIHLIFHQSNQRRYDNRRTFHQKRR